MYLHWQLNISIKTPSTENTRNIPLASWVIRNIDMLMSPSPGYIYTPVVINCATFKNTNRRHELILFRGDKQ